MTVRITKPEINVREKLAELDKPSGIAGEAMLRAETPQEQFNLISAGRRNLVMNGGFDVWQRGTSITTTGNGYGINYTSDRWIAYFIGTYSKQSTSLPNGDYVNYFRGVLGAGGSNRLNINQVIENGNSLLSGKNVTVSFWLKCNVPNKSILLRLLAVNNSTFSSYAVLGQNTFYTDTAWKKYEITVPCNNDTANISSRPHAILELDGVDADWGNGDTFEFAQVQLELGKVATPFEHRSYGEELALCQRYYQQFAYTSLYQSVGDGQAGTTSSGYILFRFLNEMRVPPTISNNGAGNFRVNSFASGQDQTCTSIAYDHITAHGARIQFSKTTADFTMNQNIYINTEQNNDAYLYISAEL